VDYLLKNEFISIKVELPFEGYSFPRFDQSGKITAVSFKGKQITGIEKRGAKDGKHGGRGLFNEFGIDNLLGFDQTPVGDWCHKIGVGLLQKDTKKYHFLHPYKTNPCDFLTSHANTSITIKCIGQLHHGFGYELTKEILLLANGFEIRYQLKNTGEKVIKTNEYCHNFLSINENTIGSDYTLRFPFNIQRLPEAENVNPEKKIQLRQSEIIFTNALSKEFFFSDLSGGESVMALWEVRDLKNKISVSETGNFKTQRFNLWGNKNAICPELFIDIDVAPGKTQQWKRMYLLQEF
jgi:hypothetical protein